MLLPSAAVANTGIVRHADGGSSVRTSRGSSLCPPPAPRQRAPLETRESVSTAAVPAVGGVLGGAVAALLPPDPARREDCSSRIRGEHLGRPPTRRTCDGLAECRVRAQTVR